MDVKMTVTEQDIKTGLLKTEPMFVTKTLSVDFDA